VADIGIRGSGTTALGSGLAPGMQAAINKIAAFIAVALARMEIAAVCGGLTWAP
jgi:hypothetical protein